jgi:hypothetical protein
MLRISANLRTSGATEETPTIKKHVLGEPVRVIIRTAPLCLLILAKVKRKVVATHVMQT